jgi:hypothetical protein
LDVPSAAEASTVEDASSLLDVVVVVGRPKNKAGVVADGYTLLVIVLELTEATVCWFGTTKKERLLRDDDDDDRAAENAHLPRDNSIENLRSHNDNAKSEDCREKIIERSIL